ncbi:TPM domain-containing protein [Paraburkholderia graminis]|uniref:Membrane protein n=1 Tax=Paraburkholderia graminis TaxID=60548 RepID=A0ABD5CH90_9BURK|nr:TPM domain-containing protein [Paraburkholderia graminis]MDR6203915.1 putative membrane protein [Paraburkholderia graminis]
MDFKRAFRHLFVTHWSVNRAFPDDTLGAIEKAVQASHRAHRGQVGFAVEGALHSAALLDGISARERAIEVFSDLRVWDTEHNNGVLIYLLLADHDVEIVADRGVHARVKTDEWEAICRRMEADLERGRYRAGVVCGIEDVTALLRKHFPAREDATGELPGKPIVL